MTLTTITPVWSRPKALHDWLKAISRAAVPDVRHLVYLVGEPVPTTFKQENVDLIHVDGSGLEGIGHWHNLGAQRATTEWIMKMDVDALPNPELFRALIPVLQQAGPREWFNCGMIFLKPMHLGALDMQTYHRITQNRAKLSWHAYSEPAATNWMARRADYLRLGGCDPRFKGWGWEDYQQIYMLEKHRTGANPLPGKVDRRNVTVRCRDEISRPSALALFKRDSRLCLLHQWHPPSKAPGYRSQSDANKAVLLDYILNHDKDVLTARH